MLIPENLVGLDFETYGGVDLPTHGLHRYVNDPTFRPLLAAVHYDPTNKTLFDFVQGDQYETRKMFEFALQDKIIVAHNAGFEQAVLGSMGIHIPSKRFIDSAVLARAAGAAGKLEAAAPQLLGVDKMASGWDLIQLFSIPGKYQEASGNLDFDPAIVMDNPAEWAQFGEYCELDAELGMRLALHTLPEILEQELTYAALTLEMNNVGWHVDIDAVRQMHTRYLANLDETIENFRIDCNEWDLNLSSSAQLREWCAKRGVKATSFDEQHVESLLKRVTKQLEKPDLPAGKRANYEDVQRLLETKQILGGSSLKKLQVILNTVGVDGRLHDQYLHIGAGATYRTTGRGVQMQNLPRLHGGGDDMIELFDESIEWDNHKLGTNLRQVFTASHPAGFMVVGDFSSVESRGLAWQAGEKWKLDAYFRGEDLYKVQAAKIFGLSLTDIGKEQRQIGKVGELSCGYGAGAEAVQTFAKNMGVELSEAESVKLVRDWRAANPNTVAYWYALDDALHRAVDTGLMSRVVMPHGSVLIAPFSPPVSLEKQVPGTVSLRISMILHDGYVVLDRVIHGAYVHGRNIRYFKPSERKTGDLWSDTFTDPKTKQLKAYTVYGGKLAGLLTQSMCRELFFNSLVMMCGWADHHDNVRVVGQFHDEIVTEWVPGKVSLAATEKAMENSMTAALLPDFPLAAEIKHDYRYTK